MLQIVSISRPPISRKFKICCWFSGNLPMFFCRQSLSSLADNSSSGDDISHSGLPSAQCPRWVNRVSVAQFSLTASSDTVRDSLRRRLFASFAAILISQDFSAERPSNLLIAFIAEIHASCTTSSAIAGPAMACATAYIEEWYTLTTRSNKATSLFFRRSTSSFSGGKLSLSIVSPALISRYFWLASKVSINLRLIKLINHRLMVKNMSFAWTYQKFFSDRNWGIIWWNPASWLLPKPHWIGLA